MDNFYLIFESKLINFNIQYFLTTKYFTRFSYYDKFHQHLCKKKIKNKRMPMYFEILKSVLNQLIIKKIVL